jgi:hypothetical protein
MSQQNSAHAGEETARARQERTERDAHRSSSVEATGTNVEATGAPTTTAESAVADTVSLVLVCGPPGVGKTTVANEATAHVDGELLRTDVVRKDLYPEPTYESEETQRVYAELLNRARTLLDDGESVVLDGTFRRRQQRERVEKIAAQRGIPFELLRVRCAEDVVRERIAGREDDASDADFEIHQLIREEFEPITREHARIDNSGTCAETCAQIDQYLS